MVSVPLWAAAPRRICLLNGRPVRGAWRVNWAYDLPDYPHIRVTYLTGLLPALTLDWLPLPLPFTTADLQRVQATAPRWLVPPSYQPQTVRVRPLFIVTKERPPAADGTPRYTVFYLYRVWESQWHWRDYPDPL